MSEYDFGRSFAFRLKKEGFDVVRIESHTTNGIPDMFVQGYGTDYWIELKSMKGSIKDHRWKIAWRPGQQAWARTYNRKHDTDKFTCTIVKLDDGYLVIPMDYYYEYNEVDDRDVYKLKHLRCMKRVLRAVCERWYGLQYDCDLLHNAYAWLDWLDVPLWSEFKIDVKEYISDSSLLEKSTSYEAFEPLKHMILGKVLDECIKNKLLV